MFRPFEHLSVLNAPRRVKSIVLLVHELVSSGVHEIEKIHSREVAA